MNTPRITKNQVLQLLRIAAAYDRRTIGEADVLAWSEAARRANWPNPDAAADAIHAHYADTETWIMPGHVTKRIRASASGHPSAKPVAEVLEQLDSAPPASPERRAELMAEIRKLADRKTL